MKVRHARIIEYIIYALIALVFLPFGIMYMLLCIVQVFLGMILFMLDWVCAKRNILASMFGHYMFLRSDERCLITDTRLYRLMSANDLYEYIKRHKL
jgi:uncharacterized membrane protein